MSPSKWDIREPPSLSLGGELSWGMITLNFTFQGPSPTLTRRDRSVFPVITCLQDRTEYWNKVPQSREETLSTAFLLPLETPAASTACGRVTAPALRSTNQQWLTGWQIPGAELQLDYMSTHIFFLSRVILQLKLSKYVFTTATQQLNS